MPSLGSRAKLKVMAAEEQKNVHDEGAGSEVLSDGDVFTDEAHEENLKSDMKQSGLGIDQELSEYDLFAGDEDFYNLLAESSREKSVERSTGKRQWRQRLEQYKYQRFTNLQKILAVSIIAVISMLLFVLLKSPSGSVAGSATIHFRAVCFRFRTANTGTNSKIGTNAFTDTAAFLTCCP